MIDSSYSRFLRLATVFLSLCCVKAFCDEFRIKTHTTQPKGSTLRHVVSEAHYAAPPETVWKFVTDFSSLPKFVPRLKALDLLGTAHGKEQIYLLLNLPIPFHDVWNILTVSKDEKNMKLEWEMIQGNMDIHVGKLFVEKEGNSSAIKAEIEADPGPLYPDWVVTWATKKYMPKILRALGRKLDAVSSQKKE